MADPVAVETMQASQRRMFGPDSMMWRINSEHVLLLGGRAALLMQLADPLVAQGVADHSNFRADPIGRLRRTMSTMQGILFGDEERARRLAYGVNALHGRVRGTTSEGRPYRATDPTLLLWVYSTLVTSSLDVYRACVAALKDEEIARYYDETKLVARLFGIPDGAIPTSLEQLRAWMDGRIAAGEVAVTPLARELAEPILRPLRVVPMSVARAAAPVTASLLHPEVRKGYGLRVSRPVSVVLAVGGGATKRVLPLVPATLRRFPEARAVARGYA